MEEWMPPKREAAPVVEEDQNEGLEEEITIDMTDAKTFEPLPEKRPLLSAVSAWKLGKGPKGAKIHVELTVKKPDELANRKVMEDISLTNEWTKGRYQTLLLALGFNEAKVKSPKHTVPKEEDILGMELTLFVNTQHSETYGDRSRIGRMRPAASYTEAAAY
jgi:hypothetical protein